VITPLLDVRGLGKDYPTGVDPSGRVRAFSRILAGKLPEQSSCLDGISFVIRPGESLGVIGENGAGKSTLLKLLSGVLVPSRGQVTRSGSLGALLELGAGFDPEQSGRSNIGLAARLMGWSSADVRSRMDEIVDFADIGRHIDEPVKHYSSGMVVRLGFAIVAAVRPDLLITDEVLAVGDESFQKKCIRWMEEYLHGGGTLLLVSHSMYHVQKLCRRALWLKDGRAQAYGDVFHVTQDYLAYHERKSATHRGPAARIHSADEYRISRVCIDGDDTATSIVLEVDRPLSVTADIFRPDARVPQFSFGITRADGTSVFGTTSEIAGAKAEVLDDAHVRYRVSFDPLPLLPGSYTLNLFALDPEGMRLFDTVERFLTIRGETRDFGLVRLAHRWE